MEKGPHIRIATPADAEALTGLGARLFVQTYAESVAAEEIEAYVAEEYSVARQQSELRDPDIASILLEVGDEAVGYAQVRRRPPPTAASCVANVELWRIYLDREWHGSGLGRDLLAGAVEAAATMSATGLWLSVWERNPRAIAFYEKTGFSRAGAQPFRVGSEVQQDLILCAALNELTSAQDLPENPPN